MYTEESSIEYVALNHALRLMFNEYERMKREYENFPDYLVNEIEFFEEYLYESSQHIVAMKELMYTYKPENHE